MGEYLQGQAHPGLAAGRPIYFQLNGFDLTRELEGSTRELRDTDGIGGTYANYVRTYMNYLSELGFDIREGVDPRGGQETVYFRDNSTGPSADLYRGVNEDRGETVINLSDSVFENQSQATRRRYEMVMHEINHALGLRDSEEVALELSNNESSQIAWNDDKSFTNMSYYRADRRTENGVVLDRVGNATLMPADYYALRDMYGLSEREDAHRGRTVLGFNTNIRNSIWANMADNMNSNDPDRHFRYFYTDDASNHDDVVDMSGMRHGIHLNLETTKRDHWGGATWSSIKGSSPGIRGWFPDLGFAENAIFEIAIGSNHNDFLRGNNVNNTLKGGAGDDVLSTGRGGRHVLEGGSGDDLYYVRHEMNVNSIRQVHYEINEEVGEGIDTIHLIGEGSWDRAATDSISFVIPENVENATYDDLVSRVTGNDADNKITMGRYTYYGMKINGLGGNDEIGGSKKSDWLIGGEGVDTIEGGEGFDRLAGGQGTDYLIGGRGWDVFRYDSVSDSTDNEFDKIIDFERGSRQGRRGDKIDLTNIEVWTDKPTKLFSKHLQFIGDDKFSFQRGEIRFADGFIEVNTDSDWDVEMRIHVNGQQRMFASDFLTGEQ